MWRFLRYNTFGAIVLEWDWKWDLEGNQITPGLSKWRNTKITITHIQHVLNLTLFRDLNSNRENPLLSTQKNLEHRHLFYASQHNVLCCSAKLLSNQYPVYRCKMIIWGGELRTQSWEIGENNPLADGTLGGPWERSRDFSSNQWWVLHQW